MNLMESLTKLGKLAVTGIVKIAKSIATAKVENVIKAGLFVGASVYTSFVLIKSFKCMRESFSNKENMTTVDRALALNFADQQNREKLSPLMKKINRSFNGKNKEKNNGKRNHGDDLTKEDRQALARLSKRLLNEKVERESNLRDISQYDNYDPVVRSAVENFKRDMGEIVKQDKAYEDMEDNFVLRRIWDLPCYN